MWDASVLILYIRRGSFGAGFDTLTRSYTSMSTMGPPPSHVQNDDDIQGLYDSDSPQDPVNIHLYEVVYINSFNTHNLKMQDSGNNNSCWSLSSCCSSNCIWRSEAI